MADLEVSAEVVRPGRTVSLTRAELHDVARGRAVASVSAWLFPPTSGPVPAGPPLGHSPADGEVRPSPAGWSPGYLEAVEWRWISGGIELPGAGGGVDAPTAAARR